MIIFVGSTNPVKINAVKQAAARRWPDVEVIGLEVPSGVSAQPMSDEETRQGARERARAALQHGPRHHEEPAGAVLGVGLEGGVMQQADGLYSVVWVVLVDRAGQKFESSGARFRIPDRIATDILAGIEMGDVVSGLMNGADVKRNQGMIGLLTNNFVDRTSEYSAIAAMTIGLWYGRDWEEACPI